MIVDYDCVPTYSQTLVAQIVDMDNNVIIPETSLKTGTIELCPCKLSFFLLIQPDDMAHIIWAISDYTFVFAELEQSYPASHYSLRRHAKGYFYMVRNQTLTNRKNDQMKRDKQEIQRLKRALKGRSLRMILQNVFLVLVNLVFGFFHESLAHMQSMID